MPNKWQICNMIDSTGVQALMARVMEECCTENLTPGLSLEGRTELS